MKKVLAITLAVIMIVALFAGCGPKKPEDDTLSLWITTLGEESDIIKEVTNEQWNVEHPDKKVKVTVVSGNSDDFYQKLSTAFATGTGPDMFSISNAEILKYVETGIAYPVTKWIEPNISDYSPETIEYLTYNGEIVAFPGNMDLMALYCNKAIFEEAELDYPTTWAELIEAANTLATEDRYGIIVQTDTQSGYQLFEFYPFLWMCGGSVLAEDGKTVTVNSDATAQAFEFYKQLLNAPGTCKKVENSNTDITPFGTGRTAMQICGAWAISWLQENYPDLEYVVVPYPTPEEGMASSGVIGGWQYMVSSRSSNPEAAAEYLNWLWNEGIEIPAKASTLGGKFSPRISVRESEAEFYSQYPYNVFLEEILPVSEREPSYNSAVVKAMGDALQDAVYTDKSIKDILKEAQSACEDAVNK